MKTYIELLGDTKMPEYAHDGDAGIDIRATEDIIIKPRETVVVKTGLKIAVPKGVEIDIRPRSGLSLKTPLRVSNAPGTIDSGYRDEIGVIIQNTSLPFTIDDNLKIIKNDNKYSIDEKGNKEGIYIIKKGDRIAQMVFLNYINVDFNQINDIHDIGEDRKGGFGSSGTK